MLASALLVSSCMNGKKQVESPVAEPEPQQPVVKKVTEPRKTTIKPRPLIVKEQPVTQTEPRLPEPFIPRMPGKRIAQVNVPGPYVAITFDDGPSPANTPAVLDILKRHGAKATFFVVGQSAARHKEILARAVAEGHEVGAHTWSHIKMSGSSDEKIISEMDRTNAAIAEATGRRPVIMRPPYGATSSHVLDLMMSRYGMASIMWSIDTEDWKHPGVGVVTNRAVNQARNGSIILLHDIHASTLAAVEGIVTGLQNRGFRLVTVSELIEMGRRAANDAGVAAAEKPAEAPVAAAAPVVMSESAAATPAVPSATAVMVTPASVPAAYEAPTAAVAAPSAEEPPAPFSSPAIEQPAAAAGELSPAAAQEIASPSQDI